MWKEATTPAPEHSRRHEATMKKVPWVTRQAERWLWKGKEQRKQLQWRMPYEGWLCDVKLSPKFFVLHV